MDSSRHPCARGPYAPRAPPVMVYDDGAQRQKLSEVDHVNVDLQGRFSPPRLWSEHPHADPPSSRPKTNGGATSYPRPQLGRLEHGRRPNQERYHEITYEPPIFRRSLSTVRRGHRQGRYLITTFALAGYSSQVALLADWHAACLRFNGLAVAARACDPVRGNGAVRGGLASAYSVWYFFCLLRKHRG